MQRFHFSWNTQSQVVCLFPLAYFLEIRQGMNWHQVEPAPGTPLALPGYMVAHQIIASEQNSSAPIAWLLRYNPNKICHPALPFPIHATYLLSAESYLALPWFHLTVKQNINLVRDVIFASSRSVFSSSLIYSINFESAFSCVCWPRGQLGITTLWVCLFSVFIYKINNSCNGKQYFMLVLNTHSQFTREVILFDLKMTVFSMSSSHYLTKLPNRLHSGGLLNRSQVQ